MGKLSVGAKLGIGRSGGIENLIRSLLKSDERRTRPHIATHYTPIRLRRLRSHRLAYRPEFLLRLGLDGREKVRGAYSPGPDQGDAV